jgi:transcriptional regulator with XRE-family HTH domain
VSSTTQRTQLSDFLKSCRARTPPDAVGLTRAHRSRSRGLRREDVAALAGLSATWYTWLEQGRDVHPSDQVLERLSTALGLSAVERDYLFMLAQGRPPAIAPSTESEVRPAVRRMLEALNVPAIVHSRTWDVVAWNRVWPRCFPDFAARAPDDRNLLKILLTEQDFQHDMAEYERMARRVLAKARLDYSQAAKRSGLQSSHRRSERHLPDLPAPVAQPRRRELLRRPVQRYLSAGRRDHLRAHVLFDRSRSAPEVADFFSPGREERRQSGETAAQLTGTASTEGDL